MDSRSLRRAAAFSPILLVASLVIRADLMSDSRSLAERDAPKRAVRGSSTVPERHPTATRGPDYSGHRAAEIEVVKASQKVDPAAFQLMLAVKASTALHHGDYDRAVTLLREAISLDADDAGAAYNPLDFADQESDALKHGRRQLMAMLADRPQMSAFSRPSDSICEWAAHKFAQRINGGKIYWRALATSSSQAQSDHVSPSTQCPGMIRVNPVPLCTEKRAAFEQLWAAAALELDNIQGAREFERHCQGASNGKLTEDEFVKSMFVLEWRAAQRTRKFYVDVFLPHVKNYGLPTDPYRWYCGGWGRPDEVFARYYSDRRSYPWSCYSPYFRRVSPTTSSLEKLLEIFRL